MRFSLPSIGSIVVASDDTTNRHDLLNAVAAVLGYAEMVLELDHDLPFFHSGTRPGDR